MDRRMRNSIVKELIGKLKELPDGSKVTTRQLLKLAGRSPEKEDIDVMAVHAALFKAAEKAHILLDMSEHKDKCEGLPENLDYVAHNQPEQDEDSGFPLTSPIFWFDRYLELIFAKDELWEQFQMYVEQTAYDRDERFFAFHRDPECIDIWRQMLDNMGGGFPLSLFAAAAFLLLTYRDRGHDLDAELELLHKTRE